MRPARDHSARAWRLGGRRLQRIGRPVMLAAACLLGGPYQSLAASESKVVGHSISVTLDPASGYLSAQDEMRLPSGESEYSLLLHSALTPRITAGDASLIPAGSLEHLSRYRLAVQSDGPITIAYEGRIQHALEHIDEGLGRARQWSRGTVLPEGVFLDGASGWYPRIADALRTFQLEVKLPNGWLAVSQGAGPDTTTDGRVTWREDHPQDDIYLVAGPYTLYRRQDQGVEAQVYLREPDEALARRYLDATAEYVAHYSSLIGDYPFAKFALVENFWETGYGMPSFTLLGSRVIRLPFILHTSYPHEILHNWWGNGVYVDDASGNWSEGLTYYQADYWLKERAGQGAEARRDMLKSYADYVHAGQDFPLTGFRGKHDMASQGIGYSKAAMFFHMLKRSLGDAAFDSGLKRFYAAHRFSAASYSDLRRAFEETSGQSLDTVFQAWTTQPGAPVLALDEVALTREGGQFRVTGRIRQTQSGPAFPLQVPVVIELERGSQTIQALANGREQRFGALLPRRPVRLAVDPGYDVFRALLPGEMPVTLSSLLGASKGLIVVPSSAERTLRLGYLALARTWQQSSPGWSIVDDSDISSLPSDRPVWLLGWENLYGRRIQAEHDRIEVDFSARRARIAGAEIDGRTGSIVVTGGSAETPIAWLAATDARRVAALARKVPHYGKYSYLVLSGPQSQARLKGQWPSGASGLSYVFETPPDRR